MIEFLKFVTIDPITTGLKDVMEGDWSGLFGVSLGLITILTIVSILSVICLAVYEIIDTRGPTTQERGTVTNTRHVPAHMTMIYNAATKTSTPIFHPPRWYAAFSVKGAHEELCTTENVFGQLEQGDQMDVLVTQGKLSKKKRIVGFAA